MIGTLVRRLVAAVLFLGGGTLVYFAGWISATDVAPRIMESGWSLQGSNMILNHDWKGNQLYILLGLYLTVGIVLMLGGGQLLLRTRGRSRGR